MEHEKRMAEEEQIKQNKELEVLNMEKLEMELIKKLQHTQMLQKAAYEELEVALAEEPQEYEKKYLNSYGEYEHQSNSNIQSRRDTPGGREDAPISEKDIQGRPQESKEELNISNSQKQVDGNDDAKSEKKSETKSQKGDEADENNKKEEEATN